MLESFADGIVKSLIEKNAISAKEKEVYLYGIMLWITTIIGVFSIIIISSAFFKWYWGVLFLIFYTPLRVSAGGYHCNSSFSCFIVTNIIFLVNAFGIWSLSKLTVYVALVLICCILIISNLYIILNAPVTTEGNRLSLKRIHKNRIKRKTIAWHSKVLARLMVVVVRFLHVQKCCVLADMKSVC